MGLNAYLKGANVSRGSGNYPKKEKRCLECDKLIDKSAGHLYYKSFCSEECKEDYIKGARTDKKMLY